MDNRRPVSTRAAISLEKINQLIADTLPRPAAEPGKLIFGSGGVLDSLDLVNFLADLEYRLAEEFGREVVLASDRAMSRTRSPFRDVDVLAAYILELLSE
jgi:hypothetical protein